MSADIAESARIDHDLSIISPGIYTGSLTVGSYMSRSLYTDLVYILYDGQLAYISISLYSDKDRIISSIYSQDLIALCSKDLCTVIEIIDIKIIITVCKQVRL